MASLRAFLLLALAFAVVLLITSEVAAAKELASENDSEINDSGHGGYNKGGRGGVHYGGIGGRNGGNTKDGGRSYHAGRKSCRHGCCGGGSYTMKKGCNCCSSFEEATAYKQTQN